MDVASIIRWQVEQNGFISLARFMELALYCPEFGYYERRRGHDASQEPASDPPIGREGDYYTSVSTGSLFGQLLAFQFDQWLGAPIGTGVGDPADQSHRPASPPTNRVAQFQIVEAGAHDGRLALDILNWLKLHRPQLLDRLEYWLVEPSGQRQSWQKTKLESFAGQVRWVDSFQTLPKTTNENGLNLEGSSSRSREQSRNSIEANTAPESQSAAGFSGIIFCNELLDSFPAHRLAWDRASGKWIEWGIGVCNDQFVWRPLRNTGHDWNDELCQAGFNLNPELLRVLPDGFIIDHCPEARSWWQRAAAALHQGRLLTIDYGFTAEQFLSPARSHGTLRAYRRHQVTGDVLANPGKQDLTSHINFTQIQKAGEDAGLRTEGLFTQAQFLTAITTRLLAEGGNALSPSQARQFQTLTHPEHLGRPFRVLIQSRTG